MSVYIVNPATTPTNNYENTQTVTLNVQKTAINIDRKFWKEF